MRGDTRHPSESQPKLQSSEMKRLTRAQTDMADVVDC